MSDPDLTPQVPGEQPHVNADELASLLQLPVVDLAAGLPALDDLELAELETIERHGDNREAVLSVIESEQERRAVAPTTFPEPEPASTKAPIGDEASYARMHARDVDATRLDRPVLTLDGWVLPLPSARPEA